MRISFSNCTPIPNEFFDDWLPKLTGNEIKVLLGIYRQNPSSLRIKVKIPELCKVTDLDKETIIKTIESLKEKATSGEISWL